MLYNKMYLLQQSEQKEIDQQQIHYEDHQEAHFEYDNRSTQIKWNLSQSTNYQTHHSHLYSQSPKRNIWSNRKSKPNLRLSNSPQHIYNSPQQDYSPTLLATQSLNYPQGEFKLFKLERVEVSPQKLQFRSRTIRTGIKSSISTPMYQMRPVISATHYIAIFTESNEPLLCLNADEKRQIASLTKIMTAYTVIQICHEFGIKIRQHYVPILTRASYMEGTTANLRNGEEILIIDLLYGLLLPSGNDAGTALAQYFGKFLSFKFTKDNNPNQHNVSNLQKFNECKKYYDSNYEKGSIRLFVFQMNKYAHKIGMTNTKFINPTGLTHLENYSTVRDVALLTTTCLKEHVMRLIFKRKVHKCEVKNEKLGYNRQVIWKNTNKLLYKIKECIGVKTGLTPGAGPCLSSAYRIGSKELVVVVLNSSDHEQRFNDSEKLYKWCRKQSNPHF